MDYNYQKMFWAKYRECERLKKLLEELDELIDKNNLLCSKYKYISVSKSLITLGSKDPTSNLNKRQLTYSNNYLKKVKIMTTKKLKKQIFLVQF